MTNETPADDLIRYDVMVQDALIGVVRKVLQDAARRGLPGEHHFYISFRTHGPGVRVSTRLREKHPDEMTIVLQHQFWDLIVSENGFEVGLSFGGVPERLLIPFEAMTGFFDPSVQFGLKFAADEATADNDLHEDDDLSVKQKLDVISEHEKNARPGKNGAAKGEAPAGAADNESAVTRLPKRSGEPAPDAQEAPPARTRKGKAPKLAPPADAAGSAAETSAPESGADPVAGAPATGAEVVSLDAFRKKK